MAKRFMAWVIVTGATPTAFRSRYREDLLPTLHQLQRKHPDTRLAWFERNRFWDSPEAARMALEEKRRSSEGRGRDWRPGGEHKDPRAKYQLTRDEKRARFKTRQRRDSADGGPPPKAESPGWRRKTSAPTRPSQGRGPGTGGPKAGSRGRGPESRGRGPGSGGPTSSRGGGSKPVGRRPRPGGNPKPGGRKK